MYQRPSGLNWSLTARDSGFWVAGMQDHFRVDLPTAEARRVPKKFKIVDHGDGTSMFFVNMKPAKGNDKNETGAKRIEAFLAFAESIGVTFIDGFGGDIANARNLIAKNK